MKAGVNTGITYDDVRVQIGMVSEYEEREAAMYSGYTWSRWVRLDSRERAASVAHRRLSQLIGMHSQDAIDREVDLRAKRQKALSENGS